MGTGQFFLQAVLIFLAIYWLNRHFSKTTPFKLSEENGIIKPSKALSVFCVVVSGLFLALGLWLCLSGEDQLIGLICAGMALFGTIIMLPSLSNFHDVSWNQICITGPAGKSFPKFPTQQITIKWEDIVKSDEAWSNYHFVEDKAGQRIFWGYWYPGERELRGKIQKHLNSQSS